MKNTMSDDIPPSTSAHKKGWFDRVSQLFQGEPQNREDLVEVIHDAEQRELITEDTREMIKGVLEVSDLRVRDIMIPRAQIVAIQFNDSVEELLNTVINSAHSRFPVVNEDKDHIEGILLAKDLLKYGFNNSKEPFSLEKVIRPAVVVPESKRVDVLLKEFRSQRYHMAIVSMNTVVFPAWSPLKIFSKRLSAILKMSSITTTATSLRSVKPVTGFTWSRH